MRLSIGSDASKNNNKLNTPANQHRLFDKPLHVLDDDIQQKDQSNVLEGDPCDAFGWGRQGYLPVRQSI